MLRSKEDVVNCDVCGDPMPINDDTFNGDYTCDDCMDREAEALEALEGEAS